MRSLLQRLEILFEYSNAQTPRDLLNIARTAKDNRSRLPDGELFISDNDKVTKHTVCSFMDYYATKHRSISTPSDKHNRPGAKKRP